MPGPRRAAAIVAIATATGLACRDRGPAPTVLAPPVMPDRVTSPARWHGLSDDPHVARFVSALEAAAAAHDVDAIRELLPATATLDDWLAAQSLGRSISVDVEPLTRIRDRRIVRVELAARGGHVPRSRFLSLVAIGETDRPDGLRLTADATVAVSRLSGEVLVDPRVPWLRADLRFELSAPRPDPFPLLIQPGTLRVNEVTQDGVACRFAQVHNILVVTPADPSRPASYRLRYEGSAFPRGVDGDEASADVLGLFASIAEIDLQVKHPATTAVFGPFTRTHVGSPAPDFEVTRITGRGRMAKLWIGPTIPFATKVVEVPAGKITVESPRAYLDDVVAHLEQAAAAFAPLGPFPAGDLRVVVAHVPSPSVYEDGWILLSTMDLDSARGLTNEDLTIAKRRQRYEVIAHELAHAWFPGVIPMVFGDNPRWWEALANYLVTWAAPTALAHGTRRRWLADLAKVPLHHERGGYAELATVGPHGDTLSYSRAALILAGLEARVGRAAMARWLRSVVDSRRELPTDLHALIATAEPMLGAEPAAWLRRWLLADAGASFTIDRFTAEDGRVRGRLLVTAPTDELRIEVALAEQDESKGCLHELEPHVVVARAGSATIDLPVSDGADYLVINSDATLPLRHLVGIGRGDLLAIDVDDGNARPAWFCSDQRP